MPKIALTPAQEAQLRDWIWAGATIEEAHGRAEAAGWPCSRAKVGQLAQQVRLLRAAEASKAAAQPPEGGMAPSPDLAEVLQRLVRIEERLAGLDALPKESLEEAAVGAVVRCRELSRSGEADPRVQVEALKTLPQLIRLAKEIRDAKIDSAEAIWSPEAEEEGGGGA